MSRRSTILALAGGAAVVAGVQYVPNLFAPEPEFEPMSDPHGFRRLSAGPVSSAAFDPFVAVGSTARTAGGSPVISEAEVRGDLCRALFGDLRLPPDVVPVASFSDYYCPYCRVQTRMLDDIAAEPDGGIAITWHELPLLGDTSIRAAQAALAAQRQGAYVKMHDSLRGNAFQPTPEYLRLLSDRFELDFDRLVADMTGRDVARALQVSGHLSEIFGFIGTPALVIGRTVVQGAVDERTLRRVVARERRDGWSAAC